MKRRNRNADQPTELELAALVPDDRAVLDSAGGILAWDETAAHDYEQRHGMTTVCDGACVALEHVRLL